MLDSNLNISIVNPKKLLNSKWSAVTPVNKEKHFIVTQIIATANPLLPLTHIEIEAVFSRRKLIMPWQELCDVDVFPCGWH